jgi:energy-coupling factor transporter ATP-binding protein EcfA2
MRIANVKIRGYRCIEELDLRLDDYIVLIGPNGSGKSSVLYALNWFFNGGTLSEGDLYGTGGKPEATEISVEVTFDDLNPEDRRVLGKYGRAALATLRRTWSPEAGKDKMIGNAMQGPGFASLRALRLVGEIRSAYAELRGTFTDLANVTAKDDILAELERWENDPTNGEKLIEVDDEDATYMFGWDGENTLSRRMRMVLVPAATNLVEQVGSAGRGSALATLVSSLMKGAVAQAKASWEAKYADEIRILEEDIRVSVGKATSIQEARINERLGNLVPNAEVKFSAEAPTWSLGGDGTLNTDVLVDGVSNDVSRQGHGIQRAVMIAMLQAFVPDEALTVAKYEPVEGETKEETAERLRVQLEALPALVVAIEEPEIYQHPVRARSFARVLSAFARKTDTQVFIATHSPYFVLPEQFSTLRTFCLDSGCSSVASTSVAAVAAATGCRETKVTNVVEKQLPRSFSEGFFAEAVVFVEGDSDRVVVEAIAELLGKPFDAQGIAVLAMDSKENLQIPYAILCKLNIPVYVIADCDALGAVRNHPDAGAQQTNAERDHRASTERILQWLPSVATAVSGGLPFAYGDPTVVSSHFTLWNDDLETELDRWPSFKSSLGAIGGTLRRKRVATYRAAVMGADIADLPQVFRDLVTAISEFVSL